ncbi:MAG: LytTR family DNA-binding domain-containing protein [Algoriphagus sp.]|jgi:DNA-binding LytR/AlgR family response regulator|uniref:LytR/AlgR family response regulator transcription factor n=1 Tax=Algoriphagus sp. TaxID=1872435 RepID=UPI0026246335|nr:LytTR family DNA-binding domain-containing protein [Algoriphagus sp.]MDG1275787.1 LytTR family DNA-binding domain-containing protein [Algoriphagus sp.]
MEQLVGKININGYSTSKQKEEEKVKMSNNQELLIKDAIFVRHEGSLVKVKFKDILWLKADGNYTTLVCRKGVFSIRNILKNFESELPSKDFMRIHKSYVVRIDEIESISSKEVDVSGDLVPVGRTYYHVLINGIQKLGLTGE